MAANSQADVLGYGGAAGGGKTDLLLGLAVTQHRRSIIFRREASQGRGLTDRAREILGNVGRFNENTGVWRGIPGGRQIEFAGVKDLGDEQRFRGRPHDFIGFDEGDQFLESQFRFLQGWLRTVMVGQRCRVVIAFNPPASSDGRWLLDFFGPWINRKHPRPASPGELRWYAMLPGGQEIERPDGSPFEHGNETITPRSRTFIPARVQDNPALMATGYEAALQALPEPLRSQVLFGDFNAGLEDSPWQVIPTDWVDQAMQRWETTRQPSRRLSAIGVDVARGGADQTVLSRRYGAWFARLEKHPGSRTPDGQRVVELIVQSMDMSATPQNWYAAVNVDVIGVGASVYDGCRETGLTVDGINFGEGTSARDSSGQLGFVNVRAWAYWTLRQALNPASGVEMCLPPDPELLADLTAPTWSIQSARIRVESKEDIAKRIGRSTDCGDAVVLANLEQTFVSAEDAGAVGTRDSGRRRRY